MEKNQKKIFIIVEVIILLIGVLGVILSILFKKEEPVIDTPKEPSTTDKIETKIEKLNNQSTFFALQEVLNNFYNLLANQKNSEVLAILNPEYVLKTNLTSSNLNTYFNQNYEMTSYVAKEIHYNPKSSITYYFIKGYLTNQTFIDNDFKFYDNTNYLVILDNKTRKYFIEPITNQFNDYMNNKKIVKVEINSPQKMIVDTISEKSKITFYLNEFLNLLLYKPDIAYTYLSNDTKNKYSSISTFKNGSYNLYNSFSSKIFAYSVKQTSLQNKYSIVDDKQNNITIYEKGIMDYLIEF